MCLDAHLLFLFRLLLEEALLALLFPRLLCCFEVAVLHLAYICALDIDLRASRNDIRLVHALQRYLQGGVAFDSCSPLPDNC